MYEAIIIFMAIIEQKNSFHGLWFRDVINFEYKKLRSGFHKNVKIFGTPEGQFINILPLHCKLFGIFVFIRKWTVLRSAKIIRLIALHVR